jgi:uncharacterized protein (TIGR03085 family)
MADLLLELGPDQPTLCAGWTTRDLAAHVVVRGSRVDVAGGIFIRTLAGPLKRVQDRVAAGNWEALANRVRRRPWWAPGRLDEAANRVEYFVHHEDVRRAQPGWTPRELTPSFAAALWVGVRTQARLTLRRTPARITVTAAGHGSFTAGRGGPDVELSGDPGELVMFLLGRQAHARVELTGPEQITDRMRTAHYGI